MQIQCVMFCQPIPLPFKPAFETVLVFSNADYEIERPEPLLIRMRHRQSGTTFDVGGVGFSVWTKAPEPPKSSVEPIVAPKRGKR